jgi:glutamate/tyrosine decarboxylase-like PLP-dependent enzyme
LRSLGKNGVEDLVERCCSHARRFADGLRRGGYEVLNDVVLNQVLVSGRRAMRISVCNWSTTVADVDTSLDAMLACAERVKRT